MVAGGEGVRARGQEATESYPGRVGFGLGAAGRRLAGEQGSASGFPGEHRAAKAKNRGA